MKREKACSFEKSAQLLKRAQQCIPGGVNSPVRAFLGVGGTPPFIKRAAGSLLYDADDNVWLDYVGSWGPSILGHAHPDIISTINAVAQNGLSFGAPTEAETRLVELIQTTMPSLEMLRLVSSGTEAAMSAIRLARGFTKRHLIVKFNGCYHGHADSLLVGAGSGALTFGTPDSAGVTPKTASDTLVSTFNDATQLRDIFARHGDNIAAVIIEPIAGNMNYIPARIDFLTVLRELCTQHDSVLIFDEVMTGFRVAVGGAQSLLGITPDLSLLGKVIGGGLPLAAFGGRREIMEMLSPLGPVYQAGTLSGNPLAVACGIATLERVSAPHFFTHLETLNQHLCKGLRVVAHASGLPFYCDGVGGMFGYLFTQQHENKIEYFAQVETANKDRFRAFHQGMLARKIYLAPSMFEAGFLCSAHTKDDIDLTITAADEVMRSLTG